MFIEFEAAIAASILGVPAFGDGLMVLTTGGKTQLIYDIMPTGSAGIITIETGPSPGSGEPVFEYSADGDFSLDEGDQSAEVYSYTGPGSFLRAVTLSANGTLSASRIVTKDGEALANVTELSTFKTPQSSFAALSMWDEHGLQTYRIDATGEFEFLRNIADTPKSYLKGISETITLNIGETEYLLTASAQENGLTMFQIQTDGSLEFHDSLGTRDGLSINGPTAISVVEAWGNTYAVVGSTLTSSISMVRINDMGVMFTADHVVDDRLTRFERLAAIDTFLANDRSYVIAAGVDHGLTVFEVLPDGQLVVVSIFSSGVQAHIDTVTGIESAVIGSQLHIYLTQANRTELIELTAPLDSLGDVIYATEGAVTRGTRLDDLIIGSAGDDTIHADHGNDRIIDGDGADTLVGNGGSDVFIFVEDDHQDKIMNFQMGLDRIDLSAWGLVYSIAELEIISLSGGGEIRFGDNSLIINTSTGRMLTEDDLNESHFIF